MARGAVGSVLVYLVVVAAWTAHTQDAPAPAGETDVAAALGADAELEALREVVTHARDADALVGCTALLGRTDLWAAQRNAALEMHAAGGVAGAAVGGDTASLPQGPQPGTWGEGRL